MPRYAIFDNGVKVGEAVLAQPPTLEGKPYRVFKEIVVTDPPWDMRTQVRTGPVDTEQETTVERVWTVRDMTPAEVQARKDQLGEDLANPDAILRAFALLVLDEFNLHTQKFNAFRQAALDATSLANFQTRTSQIAAMPERTAEQLLTAIKSKLGL